MGESSAVHVRGLVRRLGGTAVLDRLDLDLAPGRLAVLLGRSGTGKTTLLRALAGLDPVQEGTVRLPERRCLVFQEPRLLPWRPVWQNVALGLPGGDARARAEARARAGAALEEVGLAARADAWPLTLSGGEAQRVNLARALVRAPDLLLLDEPFASLDALTRLRMQDLVRALWALHRPTVLLVTHDVDEALRLADRVLVLAEGRIALAEPLDLPHPRRHEDAALAALRRRLLVALGVEEATPVP